MDTTQPVVTVGHLGGDRFEVDVRGHRMVLDQPLDAGGEDAGPTPTELLVASLASCVAHYARRYLARHDLPTDGLSVTARFTTAARPARVDAVEVSLTIPDGMPEARRAGLLAVASHCTVHNTLASSPLVTVAYAGQPAPAEVAS